MIIILGITTGFVNLLRYDTFYKASEGVAAIRNIPLEIGEWKGEDYPIDKIVFDILETRSILQRSYISDKEVFLSVVYYPDTKVDFHAPEACLSGQGIEILKSTKSIEFYYGGDKIKIDVNQLIWKQDNLKRLVYYFYKSGEFIGPSYLKLRYSLAVNKLFAGEKSGSLIRVETLITNEDMEKSDKILINFMSALYPFIINYL